MSDNSRIAWTHINGKRGATVNPIRVRRLDNGKVGTACIKVSPACANCYAERRNKRNLPFGTGLPYTVEAMNQVEVFCDDNVLQQVLRWQKPRGVFWCSLTDLFADFVPDALIDRCFATMALTPGHTHIVLTKRAARMREWFRPIPLGGHDGANDSRQYRVACAWSELGKIKPNWNGTPPVTLSAMMRWPIPNVILMVTAEDQLRADERIPGLIATPAATRGVSIEPMLGPITLKPWLHALDWVIVGCESGPGRRPMHDDWVRRLRDECAAAGVAFFFKQAVRDGEVVELPELDGQQWAMFPEAA